MKMKTKSYLIGLLCAVALAGLFTITKAPAQGKIKESTGAQVVILYASYATSSDILVFSSSSSAGAPAFPQYFSTTNTSTLVPLSQAIAECLNAGFEIRHIDKLSESWQHAVYLIKR